MKNKNLKKSLILSLIITMFLTAFNGVSASPSRGLIVTATDVEINFIGASEFIDVFIEMEDGTIENITKEAEWDSLDPDIAFAWDGRILAEGKGQTIITVSYQGFTRNIQVNVAGWKLNEAAIVGINNHSIMSTDADGYITKASNMVNYMWTPSKNLTGWNGKYTFKKDTSYTGIPYSQTAYQKDEIGFANALNSGDFYDSYTRFGISMPKYGSDCSGFVSFAWGISRKTTADFRAGIANGTYPKVGSYSHTNPSTIDLMTSYADLEKGDAVVNDGHMFLIAANHAVSEFVFVYEQTPYQSRFTIWDYDDMAADKYMPFSKN